MRFLSWNVNGIRAVQRNMDFNEVILNKGYDFIGMQEVKAELFEAGLLTDYHIYWNSANKKGYSGVAILARNKAINVKYGIGNPLHDDEGRVITLEYEDFYFITVYTPNSQNELKRLDYRITWDEAFRDYVSNLDKVKPVIFCGDLNVAHHEIDIKNPKSNLRNAGFTIEERESFTKTLVNGFTDTFRYLYPNEIKYSWWSYRMNARAKNVGWRIDYFIVSNRISKNIKEALIFDEIIGSDHCPVFLEIDL